MKTEEQIIEEQIISLTDDLHAAYDTIRGLERELEKCQMSDKSDTKSTQRPTYRAAGLLVAMYAAKLNESVEELEKENAALKADRDRLDWILSCNGSTWIYWAVDGGQWTPEQGASRAAIDAARKEEGK